MVSDTDDAEADAARDEPSVRGEVEAALREVRRETLKAAVTYAVVDAAALFLAANLLLAALEPGWLPGRVGLPAGLVDAAGSTLGWDLASTAVPGSALFAAGVGLVALVGELWWRTRKPLVEQFEAVNPPVAESLRTARDAIAADADSVMARRLYADVLDGLGESSSLGLVDWRRVGVSLVVVLVAGIATVQVAVLDVALIGGPPAAINDTGERVQNYTGLRDGNEVLGQPEDVGTGNETLTARVESSGGGRELDEDEQFPGDIGGSGGGDAGEVEGQQAGFAAPDEVEDADLVREYNRRIREDANDDSGGGGGDGNGGDGDGEDGDDGDDSDN